MARKSEGAVTISVVIPTFNRGEKIALTLDSVLAQTLAPLEILVVDDGSTDSTADFIERNYAGQIRVIRQRNGGVARARNTGWRAAKGDWIAFLDHDDTFLPHKLEMLAPLLAQNDVVISRWRESDENTQNSCESPSWGTEQNSAFSRFLGWNNPVATMSVALVRRSALEQIGGFDACTVPADDWDLWLRLAKNGALFDFCDAILSVYTLHDGQQRRDETKMFRAVRRVLGKHRWQLARRPLLLWWWLSIPTFCRSLERYQRVKNGEISLVRAVLQQPFCFFCPQWFLLFLKAIKTKSF